MVMLMSVYNIIIILDFISRIDINFITHFRLIISKTIHSVNILKIGNILLTNSKKDDLCKLSCCNIT